MAAGDHIDLSMLELFRAEVETHSQTLAEGLLALEKDPSQTPLIDGLMRAAHSIKGAARIVGVSDATRIAHAMEDLLVAAQNDEVRLGQRAIDVLLRGTDLIGRIAATADQPGQGPTEDELTRYLADVAAVRSGEPAPAEPPAEPSRTLAPTGDLDAAEAVRLRDLLLRLGDPVTLDLAAVREISPAGLTVLARLARSGRTITLANPSPVVAGLLAATGLDKALTAKG